MTSLLFAFVAFLPAPGHAQSAVLSCSSFSSLGGIQAYEESQKSFDKAREDFHRIAFDAAKACQTKAADATYAYDLLAKKMKAYDSIADRVVKGMSKIDSDFAFLGGAPDSMSSMRLNALHCGDYVSQDKVTRHAQLDTATAMVKSLCSNSTPPPAGLSKQDYKTPITGIYEGPRK